MNSETSNGAVVLDLSGTRPLDTFTLDIAFPGTSKPTGWKIELAGPAHPQTVAIGEDVGQEIFDKQNAIEFAQVNSRKWKGDGETLAARRQRNVTIVCRRILGWSPNPVFSFVSPDPIAFSLDAAVKLFLRPDMAQYFQQINDYINGEKAFLQPSDAS
jgi:hypothetical protein